MSGKLGIYSEQELQAARDLVRVVVRVVRSYRLYEGDHPTLSELLAQLRKKWDAATAAGPLSLTLTARKVMLEEEVAYQTSGNNEVMPSILYEHGVVGMVFKRGLEPGEANRLIGVLAEEPEPSVDYAALLWEADLKHVQVLLDSDDLEEEDPPQNPREFAQRLATIGDAKDPPVGKDYDDERTELSEMLTRRGSMAPHGRPYQEYELTAHETQVLGKLLEDDHYTTTVRHAARIIHHMAREDLSPYEAETLERALKSVAAAVASAGDLDAVVEMLTRAHGMSGSGSSLEVRAGELTLQTFRDPHTLWAFLRSLDHREYLEARTLGEFLAALGPPAAATVSEWLLETKYPDVVAQSMRVYGEDALQVLVPLYQRSGTEARDRIAPALLEIGTPESLLALSASFEALPEETRLQLLNLIGRNEDAGLRQIVTGALLDPEPAVRRLAVGSIRRIDAPAIADLLAGMLERGELEARDERERTDFFEMLSRTGDGAVARVLADHCLPKGFRLSRFRLTPFQALCVRCLRRMRSSSARKVADELREHGPKLVRDILDDPLG